MACDFGPMGVRVNAICPGHIVTERIQAALWDRNPLGLEFFAEQYPLRRTGRPADIAAAISFLCSDDASFVTGHALVVDGGLTIQLQENVGVRLAHWVKQHPEVVKAMPQVASLPNEMETQLDAMAQTGTGLYPSLLLLESLVALALAWGTYHRISRTRLGAPLGFLKVFRFNDQFVWGLIAGVTIVFIPALEYLDSTGRNLLVFFGALYAIRGFGVLSWFLAPGALAAALLVGFAMLWWPVLNAVAVLGFLLLALAAFGLGLGDTWADWRSRARPTT
jgi:hypothetical protein